MLSSRLEKREKWVGERAKLSILVGSFRSWRLRSAPATLTESGGCCILVASSMPRTMSMAPWSATRRLMTMVAKCCCVHDQRRGLEVKQLKVSSAKQVSSLCAHRPSITTTLSHPKNGAQLQQRNQGQKKGNQAEIGKATSMLDPRR